MDNVEKFFPTAGIRTPDRRTSSLVTKPTTVCTIKFDLNFRNSVLGCILGFQIQTMKLNKELICGSELQLKTRDAVYIRS